MNKWTVEEVIEMKRSRQRAAVNRMLGLPAGWRKVPIDPLSGLEIVCSVGGEDWPCAGSETYEYRPVMRVGWNE